MYGRCISNLMSSTNGYRWWRAQAIKGTVLSVFSMFSCYPHNSVREEVLWSPLNRWGHAPSLTSLTPRVSGSAGTGALDLSAGLFTLDTMLWFNSPERRTDTRATNREGQKMFWQYYQGGFCCLFLQPLALISRKIRSSLYTIWPHYHKFSISIHFFVNRKKKSINYFYITV